jgi:tryptophan-rich sensory protein
MGDRFYKPMLFVAAVWNVIGGAFIIFRSDWIFGREGLSVPVPPLYYYAWIALFITFGIGYYIVWRNPFSNTNIILLGIIGKLAFSAVFLWNMLDYPGQIPKLFLIPVVGDLIFVILFIMFLFHARGKSNAGMGTGRP